MKDPRMSSVRFGSSRGFALIMTLGVIVLLAVATLVVATNSTQGLESVFQLLCEKQCVRAAEAGLADAIVALRADATFSGFTPASRTLPGNRDASYLVEVTNNSGGATSIMAADGTTVPVGGVYFRSTGRTRRGLSRVVTALAMRGGTSLFKYALFGDKSVSITGHSSVDAWNSSLGAYGPSTLVAKGGDVGTNAITAGSLSLKGNTTVDGDLFIGPGGNLSTVISGASSATGSAYVNASAAPLPIPSPPAAGSSTYSKVTVGTGQSQTLTPGTYGDLTVKGTLTLQTGTYVFAAGSGSTGSVLIQGSLALAPGAGPVRIFFTGSWDSSGGAVVNPTGTAANLLVVGTPAVTSVSLTGGAQAIYGFYAPTATIKISGNSDIWGSLVGSALTISGNTRIHFDTGLLNLNGLQGTVSWALTALHRG